MLKRNVNSSRQRLLSVRLAFTFSISFAGLFTTAAAEEQDPSLISAYRAACNRVDVVLDSEQYRNATREKQNQLLREAVLDDTQRTVALDTFKLISSVDPGKRYEVLRESVQLQTGLTWECPAIEHLMQPADKLRSRNAMRHLKLNGAFQLPARH